MNLSSLSKLFNYIFWQEEPPIARKMTSPYLARRSSGVPGRGAKRLRRAFHTGRGELAPQLRGFPVSPEGGQAPGMGEVSGNGTECGATCSPGLRRPSVTAAGAGPSPFVNSVAPFSWGAAMPSHQTHRLLSNCCARLVWMARSDTAFVSQVWVPATKVSDQGKRQVRRVWGGEEAFKLCPNPPVSGILLTTLGESVFPLWYF